MALRPPSLQRQRDDFYSGDPAFLQPPRRGDFSDDKLYDDAASEHARKVKLARETGNWGDLLLAGETPTTFVMQPIDSEVFRTLVDDLQAADIGNALAIQISFRAALVDIKNFGSFTMRFEMHERYGKLAHRDIANAFDGSDPRVITELGHAAFERARSVPPK